MLVFYWISSVTVKGPSDLIVVDIIHGVMSKHLAKAPIQY